MMHPHSGSRLEFDVEGQFLGFMSHDGKLKYLRLSVLSEEMQIKIPKVARTALGVSPQVGEAIRVTGIGKFNHHTHAIKLKATQIMLLAEHCPIVPVPPAMGGNLTQASHPPKIKPKIKVLLCQKSGCLKKGGKELYEKLDQALSALSLKQDVTIERTGCLKRCSAAPNLVIMPGNHRYGKVRPKMMPQIADAIAGSVAKTALPKE